MENITIIHFIHAMIVSIVRTVRDHSTGVSTMVITYIVLAVSGLLGAAIAVDEVKAATQHD